MPELSRFLGMTIRMFYKDDQKHHKPHIHVVYAQLCLKVLEALQTYSAYKRLYCRRIKNNIIIKRLHYQSEE